MQWVIVLACAMMGGWMMKNPYYFKWADDLFPLYSGRPTRLCLFMVRLCGILLLAAAAILTALFSFY